MKDTLLNKVNKYECGIVNLDNFSGNGTHWICYYKKNNIKYYFDSYGNIIDRPFKELINYLGKENIYFNDSQIQLYNDPPICGYLCVYVLNELNKGKKYENIINKLIVNKFDFIQYFFPNK